MATVLFFTSEPMPPIWSNMVRSDLLDLRAIVRAAAGDRDGGCRGCFGVGDAAECQTAQRGAARRQQTATREIVDCSISPPARSF